MLIRANHASSAYTITLRAGSITVGVNERRIVASDRAGRLYSLYRDGHTWRRGLNGRLLHKWQEHGSRQRESVLPSEADAVVDEASGIVAGVLRAIESSGLAWDPSLGPAVLDEVAATLRLAASFDSRAARLDAARFARVYSPIGILPPDQYLALVLQETQGCSFGTCTFCDLYREPYRVRNVAEFRRHVEEVRDYLGASLALRDRSIFLGAANALAAPIATLLPVFDVIVSEFGRDGLRPVHAFVDAFTGTRKGVEEYRALADRGLRRVYIGLESGHDPLLAFVRKPATTADAISTVASLKAAGIQVGVIVIVGLGGDRFAEGHVADTLAALNAMRLTSGDIVYLSDLVEVAGTSYPLLARSDRLRPLDSQERQVQRHLLRAGLVFPGPAPQIASYDISEFVY
jgi:hypothetical protein